MNILQLILACGLFLLMLFLLSFGIFLVVQNIFTVPYVPSRFPKVRKVLQEVGIDKKTKFIDLGSGDGTIVFMAAGMGAAKATGLDINPFLIAISKFRNLFSRRRDKVNFQLKSFFHQNFSGYNFVYTYLFPELMEKLEDKLFAELPKGAIVLSNTFTFREHKPVKTINKKFYMYRVTANMKRN